MLDLLFPRRCMLCEKPLQGLCADCVSQLRPPAAGDPPAGLESLTAICSYEGAGRELVLALKRGNRRDGVDVLGASLAEALIRNTDPGRSRAASTTLTDVAGVTWAPTTPRRRRERGFDQAAVLARAVAKGLGVPARSTLRRTGVAQMGLGETERRSNPTYVGAGSPTMRGPAQGTWILVDDVVTTGATMSAAAAVLRDMGVRSLTGAAIAVTP